jgi:DNA replication licensing factor MCM5
MQQDDGGARGLPAFSAEEEEEMRAMAAVPGLYDRLWRSVAPAISGDYTTDIKKAIMCLLVGGSRKVLPDATRLRGDINVLLLGDPSTAKSQFLKFVERVAPVGVYTSGKGSSAAGLTASVVRDNHGTFTLEGGAMVLGDGGVVCIDEFDKMREEDRVAIHEAMEQQTISVAKAGITTTLNSRAAVLAAANPVFGRYDDNMSAAENIDFMPTILSRFDLIFIVRDVRDADRDVEIARHVMKIHINAAAQAAEEDASLGIPSTASRSEEGSEGGGMELSKMRRFIAYAKSRVAPRLSPEALERLREFYVKVRQEQRSLRSAAADAIARNRTGHGRVAARADAHEADSVVPITVRQLEALARVTEAVAKCELSMEATVEHANEAIRLFQQSTLAAAKSGVVASEGGLPIQMQRKAHDIEQSIRNALPVGSEPVALEKLRRSVANPDNNVFRWVINTMKRRDELVEIDEGRRVRRNK